VHQAGSVELLFMFNDERLNVNKRLNSIIIQSNRVSSENLDTKRLIHMD